MGSHTRDDPLPSERSLWHGRDVPDLDRAVSLVARNQHGVFSHGQVVNAGGTNRQVSHRLASGDWLRLDRCIYALASALPTWRRQVMAAVLSKEQAIASGLTAGSLHNIPGCRRVRPEITIPKNASPGSPLAVVRRRSDFPAISKVVVGGIPAASVAETLFDLGRRWSRPMLEGAVDDCLVRNRVTTDELFAVLDRVNGSRLAGTRAFRECLTGIDSGYVPTESELERMLFRALDDHRVPTIDRQARLSWWPLMPHRVDAVIEEWRLILEADGRTFHTKRSDFERDRKRDNLAAAHGYRVMRFTYRALQSDPAAVLALVFGAGGHRPRENLA